MTAFARLLKTRPNLLAGAAIAAFLSIGAAFHEIGSATAASQTAIAQAVPVNVVTVAPRNVRIWSQFSGRLSAVDYAEVRPEVGGRVTEVRFRDGQIVHAGDIIFVIDPRSYEAAAAKAKADLASARANAVLAKSNLDRAANLIKVQAVAQSFYDSAANANSVAVANVLVAEAALKQALVNVDYAYVKAPISGRISRPEITVGNLVQITVGAPLMTSIVSNDGIYADFEVDEQTYLDTVHAPTGTHNQERKIPVEMTVQGDRERTYQGAIYSFDNRIDTGSGTIRARARFDNANGELVPGMFVSVKLGSGEGHNALLVPERAIGTDQNKRFVFVVGRDSKAAFREVTLGAEVDGSRIVASGLEPGERVIVDGLQHVAPGAPVKTQQTVADASSAHRSRPSAR